jgi:hypothetical protein
MRESNEFCRLLSSFGFRNVADVAKTETSRFKDASSKCAKYDFWSSSCDSAEDKYGITPEGVKPAITKDLSDGNQVMNDKDDCAEFGVQATDSPYGGAMSILFALRESPS